MYKTKFDLVKLKFVKGLMHPVTARFGIWILILDYVQAKLIPLGYLVLYQTNFISDIS